MAVYEPVIGLEVHVELRTESKIFCSSATAFGGDPNHHTCPVCLGLPGVLPVLNRKVVDYGIRVGLALNCTIARFSKFDRKNYYYPDLPKNYQISQYDLPLAENGYLEVEGLLGKKRIGIVRVHMEEDAGKLVHQGNIATAPYSLVDYNRAGVPLLEIVSAPDIESPEQARAYLEKMRAIIQYTGVSDCKMEEGSLRCDGNVSVRPQGSRELGTKTEIKNMNSFRSLQKALTYEIERQIKVVNEGERVVQETRTWDDARGVTVPMRSKEEAHDYRYFPEPDLPPLVITSSWVESIRRELPELPDERQRRYCEDFGLSSYDAGVLTAAKETADFFEECLSMYHQPKIVANWVMGELARLLNAHGDEISAIPVQPAQLVELLKMIDQGTISGKTAKGVFEEMYATGRHPSEIVKDKGLLQISDEIELVKVVAEVIAANPKSVTDYRSGKTNAVGFLVGQVMKATRGKANPMLVNKLLREKLD